jgi:hypothetical protein
MVKLEDLRNRNPRAWTLLLTQALVPNNIVVAAVSEEPLSASSTVSRYLLSLAGYHEPLSLIGKRTNAVEGLFYEVFAAQFPHFTAKCWFSHIGLEDSWLVLADVQNDHPPETWSEKDFEILVGNLASLHAAYWDQRSMLEQYDLPSLLEDSDAGTELSVDQSDEETPEAQLPSQMERIERWLQGQQRHLTEHAKRTAGPSLAPLLAEAGRGLDTLIEFNGWPGIIDDRPLTALADLLDDPLPVLHPLRQLPYTLLHGDPSAERWRLTLFDDYYLLDWRQATIGPGVYDLVSFIDQLELLSGETVGARETRRSRATEETMVDSYILAMRGELGSRFDARATRQAVPAARCLLVLTNWLPQLGDWLRESPYDLDAWQAMSRLPDEALLDAGMADLLGWRLSLATIFDRFLQAYRLL